MRRTILILLFLLTLTTRTFAQDSVDETNSIFNLKQFVDLFIGFLFAFFSFFIRDWWVRRRDRINRQKKALQSIIKELEMILNIIENEERGEKDPKKDIMFEFSTEAWHAFLGEIDLSPELFAKTQEAYSAVSKINRFAKQARAVFSMDHVYGAKIVSHQKQYAEQTGKQIIQNALDQLRAQIPNKKAVEPAT